MRNNKEISLEHRVLLSAGMDTVDNGARGWTTHGQKRLSAQSSAHSVEVRRFLCVRYDSESIQRPGRKLWLETNEKSLTEDHTRYHFLNTFRTPTPRAYKYLAHLIQLLAHLRSLRLTSIGK